MTDSPLLPNLPELTEGLADGSLAESLAVACAATESQDDLAAQVSEVVDRHLDARKRELGDA